MEFSKPVGGTDVEDQKKVPCQSVRRLKVVGLLPDCLFGQLS